MDRTHGPLTDVGHALLEVTADGGCILRMSLAELAMLNRAGLGTLTFTYREPFDPECPDAPRPLRTATLRLTDDQEWPETPEPAGPFCACPGGQHFTNIFCPLVIPEAGQ